jgi:DNA-binding NarL/FixJ family response regulator
MPIGLLIADDHELIRAGLRQTFARDGLRVVGEAATAEEALRFALDPAADVLVLDISWMNEDESSTDDRGLEVLRRIRRARPDIAILIYSMHDGRRYVERCRRLGANGYLVKGVDDRLLPSAIYAVHAGEQIWSDSATDPYWQLPMLDPQR